MAARLPTFLFPGIIPSKRGTTKGKGNGDTERACAGYVCDPRLSTSVHVWAHAALFKTEDGRVGRACIVPSSLPPLHAVNPGSPALLEPSTGVTE